MTVRPSPSTVHHPYALFDVSGRSTLVVGATGAFGRVASRALAAAGARLVLAAGDREKLQVLGEGLEGEGHHPVLVNRRHDTEQDADTMVGAAVAAFGRLDIVVIASGTNRVGKVVDYPLGSWDYVMQANLRGPWLVCRAAGRRLLEQGRGGKVVMVSSPRGELGHPAGYAAYCASKGGLTMLTRTLACEWGEHGINVNAIAPTVFRSDVTGWMYGDDERARAARQAFLARIPLGRLAEPEDFIGALMFLVSAASDFCTGHVLYVDGGYMAG